MVGCSTCQNKLLSIKLGVSKPIKNKSTQNIISLNNKLTYITQITNQTNDLVFNPITVAFDDDDDIKKYIKNLKISKKILRYLEGKKIKKKDCEDCENINKDHKKTDNKSYKKCDNHLIRLKYFLSIGKYYTKNFICIIIPQYITNVYQLFKMILFIHNNKLLLPQVIKTGRIKELPIFHSGGLKSIIFKNTDDLLESDYKKYLEINNLTGGILKKIY